MFTRCFAQFLTVMQGVGVIGKAGLAIVAALDDVLRDAGQVDAGDPGHVAGSGGGPAPSRNLPQDALGGGRAAG
jgi:hypothetical protein